MCLAPVANPSICQGAVDCLAISDVLVGNPTVRLEVAVLGLNQSAAALFCLLDVLEDSHD